MFFEYLLYRIIMNLIMKNVMFLCRRSATHNEKRYEFHNVLRIMNQFQGEDLKHNERKTKGK